MIRASWWAYVFAGASSVSLFCGLASGCTSGGQLSATGDGGAAALDGAPPATGSSDGGAAATPIDVCAAFIACAYATAPDQAAGAEAAYGSHGACFETQSATVCERGCATALAGLHELHPSAPECALCKSDVDCDGAEPACDTAAGACVACTTNAHCRAPTAACDTARHTCVGCATSKDCAKTPATPACDTSTGTCVGCTGPSDCASHRCEKDHTCCVASTSCAGYQNCGNVSNGCGGTIACGACAVGTCVNNHCSTRGMACMPGAASCAQGEKCMFDAKTQAYQCHDPNTAPFDGSSCNGPLNETYCYEGDGQFYLCSSQDVNKMWHCQQVCLTSADCLSGKPCMPYFDKTIISPAKPGYCN